MMQVPFLDLKAHNRAIWPEIAAALEPVITDAQFILGPAVERFERGGYDIIFMDCQMPLMDGFQATAEIRKREAVGVRTPIVAMTANASTEDRDQCLAAGMDDFVSKPITRSSIATVVQRFRG